MSIAERTQLQEYETFPFDEDDMPEGEVQDTLLFKLVQIFKYLFRAPAWYVARNLPIYPPAERMEKPLVPDVAVFIGVPYSSVEHEYLKSWMLQHPAKPAPGVVFEVISDESWQADLISKPERYAAMGVEEYYAYDPRPNPVEGRRLWGWRSEDGMPRELPVEVDGSIWSVALESWLVPDGRDLRLYDRDGALRLTGEEAARQAEEAARRAEESERRAKEVARQEAEVARQAEETARRAKERAWALLRQYGIDPEGS